MAMFTGLKFAFIFCFLDLFIFLFFHFYPFIPRRVRFQISMIFIRYRYKKSVKKLRSITGKSGLIEEELIRQLDRSVSYTAKEMMLILAHLNIVKQYIDTGVKYSGRC